MRYRLLPVIFYTTIFVTLIFQVVALDVLKDAPAQSGASAVAADADSVFWDASGWSEDHDSRHGHELTVDQFYDLVQQWSDHSRQRLTGMLRDRPAGDERLRLVLQAPDPGELRYVHLTQSEARSFLSALHRRG